MQHLYLVHPVECQPQWYEEPYVVYTPAVRWFVNIGRLVLGLIILADAVYALALFAGWL